MARLPDDPVIPTPHNLLLGQDAAQPHHPRIRLDPISRRAAPGGAPGHDGRDTVVGQAGTRPSPDGPTGAGQLDTR